MTGAKRWYASRTIRVNAAALLLAGVAGAIQLTHEGVTWATALLALLAAWNIRLRLQTSSPIVINGNVGQIGGTTFTGATQIGALAGDDIGTLTETPRLVGSPPFVEVVTAASGGVLPAATLQPPDEDPLHGGTRT